ncbi:UNVERIFIED_CONTAM: hypothetical protein NCL1_49049 [Trichonephila clavipes]
MFYFHLANLALFSNTMKIRLLFICRKKDSGFRYPHDRAELSDLSDDNNAANKTYESRILEGEPSSDESDEETHGNI